jgi:hypothetical protein
VLKYYTNALKSRYHSFFTEIVYDKINIVIIAYNDAKINDLEIICA